MRTPALPLPRRIAVGAGLALLAAGLTPIAAAPANAASAGLVINEVYGGGGNSGAAYTNDFIELHNPSSLPISVNGLSLQYRAAAGTGAPGTSNVFALPNKTIQPGGYFLVQAAAGATITDKPLPVTPDAQTTGTNLALSGTGGQIYLANGTAALDAGTGTIANANVIDFVGWGTSTTSYEGAVVAPATRNSAPATANATSISRKTSGDPAVVQDTDSNSADFASATTPSPTTTSVAEPLAVADVGNKSAFVGSPLSITLAAAGGTSPYTWRSSTLPAGLTLTGNQISGSPSQVGTTEVTVTATDSATPTAATATKTFTIAVEAAPVIRPIAEIQGTGPRSPLAPQTGNGSGTTTVTTEGVVTARLPCRRLQRPVHPDPGHGHRGCLRRHLRLRRQRVREHPGRRPVGDSVRVTGPIAEFNDLTQIVPASADAVTELATSLGTVTPRAIAYPTTDAGREAREGELLAPTDTFTVSNSYSTNQYAEVGLATGTTPLKQMTEFAAPSDTAAIQAIRDENYARGGGPRRRRDDQLPGQTRPPRRCRCRTSRRLTAPPTRSASALGRPSTVRSSSTGATTAGSSSRAPR